MSQITTGAESSSGEEYAFQIRIGHSAFDPRLSLFVAWTSYNHRRNSRRGTEDRETNIQEVISSTRIGKKTLENVKKQFDTKYKELAKQYAEVDSLKRRLSDQSSKLSDKERDKLTATIESKEKAAHSNEEQIREEVGRIAAKGLEKLGAKVAQVLSNYAQTNGYAAILDTSGPTMGILWASEGTVRSLRLIGKPQAEIEKGLLAALADRQALLISDQLIAACDAEIHSLD